jgi:recombinational DNA repair protein (RecF pathway)
LAPWLPATLAAERENVAQAAELLKRNASASELADFEKLAASRTLALLRKTGVTPETKECLRAAQPDDRGIYDRLGVTRLDCGTCSGTPCERPVGPFPFRALIRRP